MVDFDNAADKAMRAHQEFRRKHWGYFYSTERIVDGVVIPRQRRPDLDNESMRLFQVACDANNAALDAAGSFF